MKAIKSKLKGAVTLEYALLSAIVITPILYGISQNNDFFPSCDVGSERNLCALFASTGPTEAGEQASVGSGNAIGDADYNANPDSPYIGAFVFGAGQMLSFEEKKAIFPRELFPDGNWQVDYRYPTRGDMTVFPLSYLLNSNDSRTGQNDGFHDWFMENRMLELDGSVNCSDMEGRFSVGVGYCRVSVNMPVQAVIDRTDGSRMQPITSGITFVETIDYGQIWFNANNQPVDFSLSSTRPADLPWFDYYATKIEFIAPSNIAVSSGATTYADFKINGEGHVVSVNTGGSYLELSNGNFEVGSGIQSINFSNNSARGGGLHLYKPAAGAVVAGYLQTFGSISGVYDNMNPNTLANHAIDLRESPEWSLKDCQMREVTFKRALEADFSYEDLRARDGFTGPRAGMAVIMENSAGETFELIHVDRQSFPGECSTENPHLFLQ